MKEHEITAASEQQPTETALHPKQTVTAEPQAHATVKPQRLSLRRRVYHGVMRTIMICSVIICCIPVVFVTGYVMIRGIPNITWNLLSTSPTYLSGNIGILPDILNTLYIILATLLFVLPLGVGAAIYLNEYATNHRIVKVIEYAAEILSGIPSII